MKVIKFFWQRSALDLGSNNIGISPMGNEFRSKVCKVSSFSYFSSSGSGVFNIVRA